MEAATGPRLPPDWESWPLEKKRLLLHGLRQAIHGGWRTRARPEQLPPADDWTTLFLRGGRGSGKTWAGAHILCELIEQDPAKEKEGPGKWAAVAPSFGEARDKCIEGEAGILAALGTTRAEIEAKRSPTVKTWNRSIGELVMHNGSTILIDGADDGATSIQGENLRGAWCDEVGLWKRWQTAWEESVQFALRKGQARVVATGTPKRSQPARKLVKRLLEDPAVVSRRLRTVDNIDNLSPAFLATVSRYKGTTLGLQELEGELLEDVEGALWKRSWFEAEGFRTGLPYGGWQKIPVVGVDPADGSEEGDEHAYTVSALGMDHELYVVENEGMRCSPYSFACTAIRTAQKHKGRIVVEKNHGGAWLVEVFERAMKDLGIRVPLKVVHASQGKLTRAEPVASLYEPREEGACGRVHHVGQFEELEDQLANYAGAPGEKSPDRLDSLVWSLSEFTTSAFGPPPPEDKAVPWSEDVPQTEDDALPEMAVPWS